MNITKRQLKRIIIESFDDQAIEHALMSTLQKGRGSASALELLDAYRNLVGTGEDVDTFSRVLQGLMDKGWISSWEGAQSGNPEDAMLYTPEHNPRDQYMESSSYITKNQFKQMIHEKAYLVKTNIGMRNSMKLTKRQLRHIIQEETAQAFVDEIKSAGHTQQLNEFDIGAFVKKAKGVMKNVTDFKTGVQKFLKDNKDWIDPVYDMVKSMKADNDGEADSDDSLASLEVGDKSPSGKGEIVDIEQDGDNILYMLDDSSIETYNMKTGKLIPERYTRRNQRLIESRLKLKLRQRLNHRRGF